MPYITRLRRTPVTRRRVVPVTPAPEPIPEPIPEPTPEPTPEPVDRSEATKAELIAEAEDRGLDTSGNKPDILARLEASDD